MDLSRHDWRDAAACRGMDTDRFFDTYENEPSSRAATDAVCRSCPVIRACHSWWRAYKETGVWGGIYLTEGEIDDEFSSKDPDDWAKMYMAVIG